MFAVCNLISTLVSLYIWILLASVVLSWLVAFGVVNTWNPFVRRIGEFLERLTEPLLAPIRSVIPPIAGIDISPVILIVAIYFVRDLLLDVLCF